MSESEAVMAVIDGIIIFILWWVVVASDELRERVICSIAIFGLFLNIIALADA